MPESIDKTKALGTAPIGALLLTYAIPSVITQLIASAYNIVDRIFIGNGVGALAISGLAITLPIMNIIHAFGSLIGVGSSARMSIVLGKKDHVWAENILGNSTLFSLILGISVMSCCYLFLDQILTAFGATGETISYAREYMLIVLPGMFLTTISFNLTGLIRATGYPQKSMYILVGGALLNMLLDPLFIFVFHWGIAGAAWATTLSMSATATVSAVHFCQKSSFIRYKSHAWAIKGYIFRNITAIGMSPFLMNLASSGVVALLNMQLIRYGGDLAVGAYGIANTFGLLLLMLHLGICQGMQPIAGYNYGAGHIHRLKDTYILTMKVCVISGLVGSLLALLIPRLMASCFTSDEALIRLCIPAIRYGLVMFPLIGFTIVNSQFFMAIDKPWISIITSLSRQILILAPLSVLLPLLYTSIGWNGLTGIWASLTVSDFLATVLAAALLASQRSIFHAHPTPEV